MMKVAYFEILVIVGDYLELTFNILNNHYLMDKVMEIYIVNIMFKHIKYQDHS